jgi:hypothetical protein
MIHRTPKHHLPFLSLISLAFLGGCYHETWTYRAIPDVNVSRPYEPGSQGPLVLVSVPDAASTAAVKHDPKERARNLSPQEIGRMDPTMARLLSQKEAADERLHKLQNEGLGASHPKIMEAQLDAEELAKDIESYAQRVRGSVTVIGVVPAPAQVETPAPQTVLIMSVQRDYGSYDRSVGRSVVIFIDGSPAPGTHWLNADNSVLITQSAFTAPARTRVGLVGSVKIIETKGDTIVADVAVRENVEGDTSTWVEKPYDAATWELPWVITGRREFKITTPQDPALRKAAVQWIDAPETKK